MSEKLVYLNDNFCTRYKLEFHRIAKYLKANKFRITNNIDECETVILGLCAAFEADESKSLDWIRNFSKAGKKIYAYGCYVKVREDVFNDFPDTRCFYTWQAEEMLNEIVPNSTISFADIAVPYEFRTKDDYRIFDTGQKFVALTSGCSFSCSYCPHKLGAGDFKSSCEAEILKQIDELKGQGQTTLFLTGIDTAAYGSDNGKLFSNLLREVLRKTDTDVRIHISQFNPEGLKNIYEDMVQCCFDDRIIDFQLPIQTSSPRLLELMNRHYSPKDISEFIKRVKLQNKNIKFRTDLLIGFPTETLEELEQSVLFAIEHYDEIVAYSFELKQGTPVSEMNLKYHSEEEKMRRKAYVYDMVKKAGKLVQSGAQAYETMLENDKIKYEEDCKV